MYYSKILTHDMANGPNWRVSLFVSGCRNRCPGCFNKKAWDFNYGQQFTSETMSELLWALKDPNISGLSILGGDPFELENIVPVTHICKKIKERFPEKSIWVWTGYSIEDVWEEPALRYIDVLIDGKFELDKKDLRLKWKGSSNQRVVDIRKTFETGEVTLVEGCE